MTPSGFGSCPDVNACIAPQNATTNRAVLEVNHVRAANGEPALLPVLVQTPLLRQPTAVELLRSVHASEATERKHNDPNSRNAALSTIHG